MAAANPVQSNQPTIEVNPDAVKTNVLPPALIDIAIAAQATGSLTPPDQPINNPPAIRKKCCTSGLSQALLRLIRRILNFVLCRKNLSQLPPNPAQPLITAPLSPKPTQPAVNEVNPQQTNAPSGPTVVAQPNLEIQPLPLTLESFKLHPSNTKFNSWRPWQAQVFAETELAPQRGYIDYNNQAQQIPAAVIQTSQEKTIIYDKAPVIDPVNKPLRHDETCIIAIEKDLILAAKEFRQQGYRVAMNTASSATHPGGDPKGGAGALEETVWRCSVADKSGDPAHNPHLANQLKARNKGQSPRYFIPEKGAIYSPDVYFFRDTKDKHYRFLPKEECFTVNLIAAAAQRTHTPDETITKDKMRAQILVALDQGDDILLLTAFGNGAFGNPTVKTVKWWLEVFLEPDVRKLVAGRFKAIVFPVINDHNNPYNAEAYKAGLDGWTFHKDGSITRYGLPVDSQSLPKVFETVEAAILLKSKRVEVNKLEKAHQQERDLVTAADTVLKAALAEADKAKTAMDAAPKDQNAKTAHEKALKAVQEAQQKFENVSKKLAKTSELIKKTQGEVTDAMFNPLLQEIAHKELNYRLAKAEEATKEAAQATKEAVQAAADADQAAKKAAIDAAEADQAAKKAAQNAADAHTSLG